MSNKDQIIDAHIRVSNRMVHVALGSTEAQIPIGQLEAFIRTLEAARVLAGSSATIAAAQSAPTSQRTAPSTPKRRSRKRVGDALVAWMQLHPGWHHEEFLLKTTIDLEWTDAQPKRALKIALGKGRGKSFEDDGKGHWKLLDDTTAGPPPKRRGKRRKKRTTKRNSSNTRALSPRRARHTAKTQDGPQSAAQDPEPGRKVLVKKGESRKHASMVAGEEDARKKASDNVSRQSGRWAGSGPSSAVDRARRNLLGIGPADQKTD